MLRRLIAYLHRALEGEPVDTPVPPHVLRDSFEREQNRRIHDAINALYFPRERHAQLYDRRHDHE